MSDFIISSKDFTYKNINEVQKIVNGDTANSLWGCECILISEDEFNHLRNGGIIGYDINGEYVCFIRLDKEITNKCYPIDVAVNNCYSPFDNSHEYDKVCSRCFKKIEYKSEWKFCPYCGRQFE